MKLPDVTLVLVETREHALAALALEDCLRKVEFGDVLVLTDKPDLIVPKKHRGFVRTHRVEDWPSKLGWSRSWWHDVPPLLRTPYTLNIQWDSWVWNTALWSDEFYNYDYIGAPWWYKDGKNVGNGGFSWVSTRLKRYLRDKRAVFPCDTSSDDDLLCRKYRPTLENFGFRWAPEKLAHQFAFECCRPSPTSEHFGFHGAFNFGQVLSEDELLERFELMLKSKYISNPNGYMWKAFVQNHPKLFAELDASIRQLKPSANG